MRYLLAICLLAACSNQVETIKNVPAGPEAKPLCYCGGKVMLPGYGTDYTRIPWCGDVGRGRECP